MNEIERIKRQLETETDHTTTFDLLLKLTWQSAYKDLEGMHAYFSDAKKHLPRVETTSPKAPYQFMLLESFIMAKHDQALEALPMASSALSWFKEHDDIEGHILSLRVIGLINALLGRLDKAIEANKEGLNLIKVHHVEIYEEDQIPLAFVFLNNIASIYSYLERQNEALQHFEEALEYVKDSPNSAHVLVMSNIGLTQVELGKCEEALQTAFDALEILDKVSLGPYYYSLCHNCIGMAYKSLGKFDEAMTHFLKSLDYTKQSGIKYITADTHIQIGKLLSDQSRHEEAFPYVDQALKLGRELNANELLRDAHMLAAICCESFEDYKSATAHLKQYLEINKAVLSKELEDHLNQYTTSFKIEEAKKDAEIYKLINVELKAKNEEIQSKAIELEESHRNITILSQIGQEITSSLDVEHVLNTIYENIRKLMKVNILGIGLFDSDTNVIDYKMFIEESVRLPNFSANINAFNGVASTCIRTKQPIIENDFQNSGRLRVPLYGRKTNGKNPNSLIYYPLSIGDRIIGVLTVQSYETNAYSERDVESIKILASYIAIALNNSQQSEALKLAIDELEISSTTDPLTELYNRRYMLRKIDLERERFKRSTKPFSIIIADIDHFKDINDTYGHDCGDYVLKELATLMKNLLRKVDFIARWGGEEFLMLLTETDASEALIMAERLRLRIAQHPFNFQSQQLHVTMTFGISEYQDEPSMEEAFKRADRALYHGKNHGRNQCNVQ